MYIYIYIYINYKYACRFSKTLKKTNQSKGGPMKYSPGMDFKGNNHHSLCNFVQTSFPLPPGNMYERHIRACHTK